MDEIFLFLTGPNLPSDGVRLDNIRAPVISGKPSTFTRVDVVDDRWTYEWYTRTSGGVLDAGSYTIWATPFALGLRDLRQGDHTAIPVTLTGNVNVPLGGTLFVNGTPGAAVYLDGTLAGHTPFMQKFVPAGNHTLTLKQEGYHDAVLYIMVEDGAIIEKDLVLQEAKPSLPSSPVLIVDRVTAPFPATPLREMVLPILFFVPVFFGAALIATRRR
jgi:hypothetical protein